MIINRMVTIITSLVLVEVAPETAALLVSLRLCDVPCGKLMWKGDIRNSFNDSLGFYRRCRAGELPFALPCPLSSLSSLPCAQGANVHGMRAVLADAPALRLVAGSVPAPWKAPRMTVGRER